MIKNKKIETWKFEETLPSSLYHLTSKNSSLLLLPSFVVVRRGVEGADGRERIK